MATEISFMSAVSRLYGLSINVYTDHFVVHLGGNKILHLDNDLFNSLPLALCQDIRNKLPASCPSDAPLGLVLPPQDEHLALQLVNFPGIHIAATGGLHLYAGLDVPALLKSTKAEQYAKLQEIAIKMRILRFGDICLNYYSKVPLPQISNQEAQEGKLGSVHCPFDTFHLQDREECIYERSRDMIWCYPRATYLQQLGLRYVDMRADAIVADVIANVRCDPLCLDCIRRGPKTPPTLKYCMQLPFPHFVDLAEFVIWHFKTRNCGYAQPCCWLFQQWAAYSHNIFGSRSGRRSVYRALRLAARAGFVKGIQEVIDEVAFQLFDNVTDDHRRAIAIRILQSKGQFILAGDRISVRHDRN